jgi:hypothetical protein
LFYPNGNLEERGMSKDRTEWAAPRSHTSKGSVERNCRGDKSFTGGTEACDRLQEGSWEHKCPSLSPTTDPHCQAQPETEGKEKPVHSVPMGQAPGKEWAREGSNRRHSPQWPTWQCPQSS